MPSHPIPSHPISSHPIAFNLLAPPPTTSHLLVLLVQVWADHGDYAGDYGLVEKWPSGLEDVLTRVPFLVRTPGGKAGHVVKEPIQLYDLVPTMLDLAGINLTHVQFGVSQAAQILHGAHGDVERAVFSEGGYATTEPRDFEGDASNGGIGSPSSIYYPKLKQQQEVPLSVCRAASVRTLTHKLVVRTDPTAHDHYSELYDLTADPRELTNLYGEPHMSGVQARLRERLFLWMMHTSDATPWIEDPRNGGWPDSVAATAQPPKPARAAYFADVARDTAASVEYRVWHEEL
jgi:arylsulfatase A-like enzyme